MEGMRCQCRHCKNFIFKFFGYSHCLEKSNEKIYFPSDEDIFKDRECDNFVKREDDKHEE